MIYELFFVFWWGLAILAIPSAIVGAGLAIASAASTQWVLAVEMVLITITLIAYTIVLRTHRPRVLIRSGAFPALYQGDEIPRTVKELLVAVKKLRWRRGNPPPIVNAGWGCFLQRSGPLAPRLFLYRLTGRFNGEEDAWLAGTTLASIQSDLSKRTPSRTLGSHPTMDYIGVGSWFAAGNHGNNGDAGVGTAEVFGAAGVIDMLNQTQTITMASIERVDSYKTLQRMFENEPERYLIVWVKLNHVDNRMIQKLAITVDNAESCAEWLNPGAILRVCFVGAARPYGIGLRWQNTYSEEYDHIDPHDCARFCMFLQVDVLSSVKCGWCFGNGHERIRNLERNSEGRIVGTDAWRGKTTLANANKWAPSIFPFMTVSAVLSGTRNFEVFFSDTSFNGNRMWELLQALIELHQRIGGRTELRYARQRVCLDVSLRRNFYEVFDLLFRLKVTTIALHPSKFTDLPTKPCKRVSVSDLNS
jgi:hypothetical protein